MTQKPCQIAYVRNMQNTFTDIDENLLKARYDVRTLYLPNKTLSLIGETSRFLKTADVVVAWFASWHSLPAFLLAKMRGIPRVLITGGYDVAIEPSIEYGLRRGGMGYVISEGVFRLTTLALPFSHTAYQETLRNTPLSSENTRVLPLGVPDHEAFQLPSRKEPIAITIGGVNRVSVRRKGIRHFVEAAQYLPYIKFVVVGKQGDDSIDELRAIASSNVEFTGYVTDDELLQLLQRASVYVQASQHEGFGLSVAESMLARCVPVVTKLGSLPEVVGDMGLFLDETEPSHIAEQIEVAMKTQESRGEIARQYVLDHFSVARRAEGLYQAIDELVL